MGGESSKPAVVENDDGSEDAPLMQNNSLLGMTAKQYEDFLNLNALVRGSLFQRILSALGNLGLIGANVWVLAQPGSDHTDILCGLLIFLGCLLLALELRCPGCSVGLAQVNRWIRCLSRTWGRALLYWVLATMNLIPWTFPNFVVSGFMFFGGLLALIAGAILSYRLTMLKLDMLDQHYVAAELAFARFDHDLSGTLEFPEFLLLVNQVHGSMNTQHAAAAFHYMDRDGDGHVDRKEFAQWYSMMKTAWV